MRLPTTSPSIVQRRVEQAVKGPAPPGTNLVLLYNYIHLSTSEQEFRSRLDDTAKAIPKGGGPQTERIKLNTRIALTGCC